MSDLVTRLRDQTKYLAELGFGDDEGHSAFGEIRESETMLEKLTVQEPSGRQTYGDFMDDEAYEEIAGAINAIDGTLVEAMERLSYTESNTSAPTTGHGPSDYIIMSLLEAATELVALASKQLLTTMPAADKRVFAAQEVARAEAATVGKGLWDGNYIARTVHEPHRRAAAPLVMDDDDGEGHMIGMGLGIDAHNDARGCGHGGPADCSYCLKPKGAGHHCCMCEDD
jgi:hypothetical protein